MAEEKKEEKKEDKKPQEKEEVKVPEKKEEKKEDKKPQEKEEVKVPEKFADLVKKIEEMKVSDLAELVKILEKKFGVSSAPQVVAQAAGGGTAEAGAEAEEKSSYNVELSSVGDKKIDVIKVVRDVTQKGLKEAKGLVDSVENEPQIIKENAKKEEAEEIKKKFEEAGAKIELK